MKKVIVTLDEPIVRVCSDVSKNGNVYRYFEMCVNEQTVRLGLVKDRTELQLLRAGIDLEVK